MKKNGVELSFKTDEKKIAYNMDKCASFMARMIRKYGKQVLAEIDAEKKKEEEANEWKTSLF